LPRHNYNAKRWVRVKAAILNTGQVRPIDVYQIGKVYFVLDGNHRVSVARQKGATHIPAYVTEIQTSIELTPETELDDLILKTEYLAFLEKTQLKKTHPKIDLTLTTPGRYQVLEKQIDQQQSLNQQEIGQSSSYFETANKWYEEVYIPVINIIRERGILRDFPRRTETDLYVWISQHQESLHKKYGWKLEPAVIATDLTDQHGTKPAQVFSRFLERIKFKLVPDPLKTGPQPGKFRGRQQKIHAHDPAHLFTHMLMPLSGEKDSWQALQLGLRLAWREEAHLMGLHVVSPKESTNSPKTESIRLRFEQHCRDVGLPGEMAIERGGIVAKICEHARLCDLVIIHLAHPPNDHPILRAESGIRKLIQMCPRPLLAIPKAPEKLENLLIAYNGNPKSSEALYAAAYFAGRWEVKLYVLTVAEPSKVNRKIINRARNYLLTRNINAEFIQREGLVSKAILDTAAEKECDLIFIGGYSKPPVIEIVLGSPLDQVLRDSSIPVLICR